MKLGVGHYPTHRHVCLRHVIVVAVRVLVVIDSLTASGGAEQALAASAPGLVSAGVELIVQPILNRPQLNEVLLAAGANVLPALPSGRFPAVRALSSLIDQMRLDLVHTTLFESDLLGRIAARRNRVPVVSSLVTTAYSAEYRQVLPWHKVRLAHGADAATARLVTRFHALTEHVKSEAVRRLRLPRERIDVIPRGRGREYLGTRSRERSREVRDRIGIPQELPLIMAAARHEHAKGLDVAIEAMAILRDRLDMRDVHLVVAGREGLQTSMLRRLVQSYQLEEQVALLGLRRDVPDLLAAADVVLAPSRWEGMGSTLVEAMGIGTPIIATDIPAIRETLGGPDAAVLVPREDPTAIARAVQESLQDGRMSERRATVAKSRFEAKYTIEAVVDATIRFYERALRA